MTNPYRSLGRFELHQAASKRACELMAGIKPKVPPVVRSREERAALAHDTFYLLVELASRIHSGAHVSGHPLQRVSRQGAAIPAAYREKLDLLVQGERYAMLKEAAEYVLGPGYYDMKGAHLSDASFVAELERLESLRQK